MLYYRAICSFPAFFAWPLGCRVTVLFQPLSPENKSILAKTNGIGWTRFGFEEIWGFAFWEGRRSYHLEEEHLKSFWHLGLFNNVSVSLNMEYISSNTSSKYKSQRTSGLGILAEILVGSVFTSKYMNVAKSTKPKSKIPSMVFYPNPGLPDWADPPLDPDARHWCR